MFKSNNILDNIKSNKSNYSEQLYYISLGLFKTLADSENITFRLNITKNYLSIELIQKIDNGILKKKKYKYNNDDLNNIDLTVLFQQINDMKYGNI